MKKLKLLLVALILSQGLSAQFYYDHAKSDRLVKLMLTVTESDLQGSVALSLEADEALRKLAEESDSTSVFADYVDDEIVFFIKVLTEEESDKDVILSLNNTEEVWTNAEDHSLVNACLTKKNVGASYIDAYNPFDKSSFGVLVIFFR